jgi:hypothetical protein
MNHSKLAAITRAPITVTIGGRALQFVAPSLGDLASFQEYIKYQEYHELCRLPNVPPEVLAETLRECVKKKVDIQSKEFTDHLHTIQGVIQFVWSCAKCKQPDIEREFFEQTPLEELQQVFDVLQEIGGYGAAGNPQRPVRGPKVKALRT